MTVWLSGASGFIGSALMLRLKAQGMRIVRLVRSENTGADELTWQPLKGITDPRAMETPCDAVVHLAGVNIGGRRWSDAHARAVYESRVPATRALCESLIAIPKMPEVLLCASGIGYYGDCGGKLVTEASPRGNGFIAELSEAWEQACEPAVSAGIRVVNLRTGLVLHPAGGALKRMLLPFRLGFGGPLGNGKQFVPWITLDDLLSMYEFALRTESLSGPCNAVGPQPLRMREFSRALGLVLGRPSWFLVPRAVLNLVLGKELAGIVVMGAKAVPEKFADAGFTFRYPELFGALQHVMKR